MSAGDRVATTVSDPRPQRARGAGARARMIGSRAGLVCWAAEEGEGEEEEAWREEGPGQPRSGRENRESLACVSGWETV